MTASPIHSASVELRFTVNGTPRAIAVAPMRRLIDVLRIDLGLTGSKEGCGEGECGACSVLIDGVPMNACLIPVVQCDGAAITTVEGLAGTAAGRAVQAAFLRHGGAQCGICSPGMAVTAAWWVASGGDRSAPAIRQALAGNLCRCTGYGQIVDAVAAAIAASEAP